MEAQARPLPPWLTIWFEPRKTIGRIVDSDPKYGVATLAMLVGLGRAPDRASAHDLGDTMSLSAIAVFGVLVGPIGGLVSLYITGALVRWAGSWFNGEATSEEVRAAIAWSSVPVICALPLWIPRLILFGDELFRSSTPRLEANPLLALPLLGLAAVDIAAAIWAFVVLLNCLAEVHQFSAWRALVALLLSFLVVLVPILLFVVVSQIVTITP